MNLKLYDFVELTCHYGGYPPGTCGKIVSLKNAGFHRNVDSAGFAEVSFMDGTISVEINYLRLVTV